MLRHALRCRSTRRWRPHFASERAPAALHHLALAVSPVLNEAYEARVGGLERAVALAQQQLDQAYQVRARS